MRFERRLRDGIADGAVTLMFRRWRRTQAVAWHRYRTGRSKDVAPAGILSW